jgi:hypothetical protein
VEYAAGVADPAGHHDRGVRAAREERQPVGAVPVGIVGDAGNWVKGQQ